MLRSFAAVGLALLAPAVLALPASAQTALRAGQAASGALATTDAVLPDGTHFDVYTYRAAAAGPVTVTLRSDAFDAYLYAGTGMGDAFEATCTDDDGDPDAGLGSRCVVTLTAGETLVVRASSLSEATGDYTILLEEGAGEVDGPSVGDGDMDVTEDPIDLPNTDATALAVGATARGTLGGGPAFTTDTTYAYRLYRVRGRAGQTVTVDVRADFDTVLRLGTLDGGTFAVTTSNDDTQGSNPQIVHAFDESGDAYLLVTGYRGLTGSFEIEARDGDFAYTPPDPNAPAMIDLARIRGVNADSETAGAIALDDAQGDLLFDLYRFRASRSGEVTIAVRAPDFDAYLATGPLDGTRFTPEQTDDDSGEGYNPVLVLDLQAGQEIGILVRPLAAQAAGESSAVGPYTLYVREGDARDAFPDTDNPEPVYGVALDFSVSRPLAVGPAVAGRISASSPVAPPDAYSEGDGARYELYRLAPGLSGPHTVVVTSTEMDPIAELGRRVGDLFVSDAYDDNSAAGRNAAFVADLDADSAYFVRVSSAGDGTATGAFQVQVMAGDQGAQVIEAQMPDRIAVATALPLRVGQTLDGALTASDAVDLPWDSATDLYAITAEAGETLRIEVTKVGSTDAIDPYVEIGTVAGDVFTPLATDDDGAGDLNSRLDYPVLTTGRLVVRVSSVGGTLGGYRIALTRL